MQQFSVFLYDLHAKYRLKFGTSYTFYFYSAVSTFTLVYFVIPCHIYGRNRYQRYANEPKDHHHRNSYSDCS